MSGFDTMAASNCPKRGKRVRVLPSTSRMADEKNRLYYGDNLAVLRENVATESVDLIYLDPPFNSRQDYNVLFAEKDGNRSAARSPPLKTPGSGT